MINKKELRISNYIMRNSPMFTEEVNGKFYEVTEDLFSQTCEGAEKSDRLAFVSTYGDYDPIEIKEENIVKFGFIRYESTKYVHKEIFGLDIIFLPSGQIGMSYQEFGRNIYVPIKYIHKLQNLVFELTDKELVYEMDKHKE